MAPPRPASPANRQRGSTCGCVALLGLLALGPAAAHATELPSAPEPHLPQSSAPSSPASPASIHGVILDPDGAFIPGARIALIISPEQDAQPAHETISSAHGSFRLDAVPSGAFTLTVTRQGFNPASLTGTLAPGQALEIDPITLPLAPVTTTVDAVDTYQLAEQQIHAEEQQRFLGILPNFYVSYNWYAAPLTVGQKFRFALDDAFDPGDLVSAAALGGIQQAQNAFSGYGQGAAGYGKRVGANMGNIIVGTMLGGAVFPSLFHQDPRYFYKGTGSARSRAFYAISRAVIFRGDNGRWQPGYASVLGALSAGAISNLYYPASDRSGAALTIENGFIGIGGDAVGNLFQEFVLKQVTTHTTPPGAGSPATPSPPRPLHTLLRRPHHDGVLQELIWPKVAPKARQQTISAH